MLYTVFQLAISKVYILSKKPIFRSSRLSLANTIYGETGCSFARHFAVLSRNVGILIRSLLRASRKLARAGWNFQFEFARASCQAPVFNLP